MPVIDSIMKPSILYAPLLYAHVLPGVNRSGCALTDAMYCARVYGAYRSGRGVFSPEVWVRMCRSVMVVARGLNSGTCFSTGSSIDNAPRSASRRIAAATNGFVIDPICNTEREVATVAL